MIYRKPSYYDSFKCLASDCPDNCCHGWGIVIDDKTFSRYKKLSKDDREYVFSHIDYKEQMYKTCNGSCSFLNEKGLCNLYIDLGEDKFCKTCRQYPRHFEDYGTLQEAALSMSCPEAARLIITGQGKACFKVKTDNTRSLHNDVDRVLLAALLDVRNHIFEIIGNDKINMPVKLKRIMVYTEKVQKLVYCYERLGIRVKCKNTVAEFLLKLDMLTKKERMSECSIKKRGRRHEFMLDFISILEDLENINESWPQLVADVKSSLYRNVDEYNRNYDDFMLYMKDRQTEYEHILHYFVYTYFLGGVYDYNIMSMVKLAIASMEFIKELGMQRWLKNGRIFTVEDQIELSYIYSRQIEHSDDNLTALEGLFNAHPLLDNRSVARCIR